MRVCPSGKPMAAPTCTGEPRRSSLTRRTGAELMAAMANP